jgi:hypothetical protein
MFTTFGIGLPVIPFKLVGAELSVLFFKVVVAVQK